jgi:hypothetical protein
MLPAIRNPGCVVPSFMLRHCVADPVAKVIVVFPTFHPRPVDFATRAAELAGLDPAASMFGSVCHFIQDGGGMAWEIHVLASTAADPGGALEVAGVVSPDTEGVEGASRIRVM